MIERPDEKDCTRQDFSLTKRINSNYAPQPYRTLRPLNYMATFATFHGRSNVLLFSSQASFIASFRIETDFTIVQWQSAFLATFARRPSIFFDADKLKAFSSTIGQISGTCIGNERGGGLSMTPLHSCIFISRRMVDDLKISRTIIVSTRPYTRTYSFALWNIYAWSCT